MGLDGKGALRKLRDRVRAMLRNSRRVCQLGKKHGIGILGFKCDLHFWGAHQGGFWAHIPLPQAGSTSRAWTVLLPQQSEAVQILGNPTWKDSAASSFPWISTLSLPPTASGAPNSRDVPGAGMGNHWDHCEWSLDKG